MNSCCPVCRYRFPWSEKWKFSGVLSPRTAVCPQCKTALTWSRRPYQMITLGSLLAIVQSVFMLLYLSRFLGSAVALGVSIVLGVAGIALIVRGTARIRLERATP